jgi:uncharacterized protein (TIGR02598 family)
VKPQGHISAALPQHCSGFTLGETLFAMALIAFVLLQLVGSLPSSLDSLREAERRTAESRIINAIQAEVNLMSWSQVENLRTFRREFGTYGDLRVGAEPVRFEVEVSLPTPDPGYQAPGADTNVSDRSSWMQRVKVLLIDKQSPKSKPRTRGLTLTVFKHDPDYDDAAPPP